MICTRKLHGGGEWGVHIFVPTLSPQHYQILSPIPQQSPHTLPAGLHRHPHHYLRLQLLVQQLHVQSNFFTVSVSHFQVATVHTHFAYI